MADSTLAGIVTAFGACITAIGILVTAFAGILPILRQTREVHKIVNQQRTDMLRFQRALVRALVEHGIPIPIDQSLPDPDETTGV